jgi:succinate dehydrogenase/fumarate reductase flavoprotein subunit
MVDILIIGSGGAGLSAAIEAKRAGKSVLLVSKTYPTESQTSQAQGGINGVIQEKENGDSVENHIQDTLKSAHGLGDEKSITYMCEKSGETLQWLDDIGVPFSRDENNFIAQRSLGGASNPRACYSSDYTGLKILHTLYDTAIKEDISFLNEHMLLNFIIEDKQIKGITALDIVTSKVKQLLAKSVIVASGGYGGLYYGFTTNSNATTGDSVAAALKHGIKTSNMEYIQFHPTALKKSFVLVSESARGEGGYLVTKDGGRFVDELLPRDVVARAILEKMQEGEEVYLDLRHLGLEKIKKTMPQEYDLALEFAKKRLDTDLVPIMPAAHYTMGGIDTDMYGRTSIKNLYAIGESSSNGVHGANRLGGNSLLEIITFGRLVGKTVSQVVSLDEVENKEYKEYLEDKAWIDQLLSQSNEIDFYFIRKLLGVEFYKNVGLFRTQEKLEITLKKVREWKQQLPKMGVKDKSKTYNTNLKEFIEFINMLDLAEVVILSALARAESRGAHYRSDFPIEDEKFAKRSVIQDNGELKVEFI